MNKLQLAVKRNCRLYGVTAADLAAAIGKSESQTRMLLRTGNLKLSDLQKISTYLRFDDRQKIALI